MEVKQCGEGHSGRRGCTSNRLLTVSRRILRHRMCLHTPSTSRPRTRNLRIIAITTGFIREPRQNDKRAHADSAASSQATTVAWQRRREGAHKAAPQNIGNCPWSRTVSDMACAKRGGRDVLAMSDGFAMANPYLDRVQHHTSGSRNRHYIS